MSLGTQTDLYSATQYPCAAMASRRFLRALSILCIGTFLVFVAFHATENFVPLIFGAVGSDSLAFVYSFTFIANIFVPTMVRENSGRLGPVMCVAGSAYALYSLAFALSPGRALLFAASAGLGAGACALFVSAGVFMKQITDPSNYGLASGAFWVSVYLAGVPGSLAGYVMPHAANATVSAPPAPPTSFARSAVLFGGAAGLSEVGALLLLCAKSGGRDASGECVDASRGSAALPASVVSVPLLRRILRNARATLSVGCSPLGRRILPLFAFVGLGAPFRRVQLARQLALPGQSTDLATVGIAFAAQGAADALASAMAGRLADRCGHRVPLAFGCATQLAGTAMVLGANELADATSRTPAFVLAAVLLGLADGCYMVSGSYLLLRCFSRAQTEAAFAAKVYVHVAATSVGYVTTPLLAGNDGRSSRPQLFSEAAIVLVALFLGTLGPCSVSVPQPDASSCERASASAPLRASLMRSGASSTGCAGPAEGPGER